jgi:hypothetical protein
MSDMVERVARALYEREHVSVQLDPNFAEYFGWDGHNFTGHDYYRDLARVAIEAMQEPPD